MNGFMQMYVMRLAEEARKECENNNVIDREKLILELKDMKKILKFFHCKLQKNNIYEYSLSKTEERKYNYIIYYALNKHYKTSSKIDKLKILTGLGEIFLAEEQINNEKNRINDYARLGACVSNSKTFARAFLMPEKMFLNESTKYCYNDGIDLEAVAKSFDVDSFDAMARGEELKLFK